MSDPAGPVCDQCGCVLETEGAACPRCSSESQAAGLEESPSHRAGMPSDSAASAGPPAAGQDEGEINPFAPSNQGGEVVPTFTIATLLYIITAIGISLAMLRVMPPLVVPLLFAFAIAFARTSAVISKRRNAGEKMTSAERLLAFTVSIGIAILALGAGAGIFSATCFGGAFGGSWIAEMKATGDQLGYVIGGALLGAVIGLVGGIAAIIFIIRRLWA